MEVSLIRSSTKLLLYKSPPFFMQFNGGFVCSCLLPLSLSGCVQFCWLASGTKVMSKRTAYTKLLLLLWNPMTLPYQALACPPITTIYLEQSYNDDQTTRPPYHKESNTSYVELLYVHARDGAVNSRKNLHSRKCAITLMICDIFWSSLTLQALVVKSHVMKFKV